jgi:hypothetical protein
MGALISACKKGLSIKNMRSECNESMGPTARLIAVPPGAFWAKSDMTDFTTYVQERLHDAKGARWYAFFGPDVPVRRITNNKEADVTFTADDGTQIFIRYGVLNRSFGTTEGGLCFAAALQSLNKSGYSFIEIDNANQVMVRVNTDGSYSALKSTFVYSPSPDLADFKNPGFTNFSYSIKPEEYVQNGVIFQADDDSLLDLLSLADTEVTDAGASSTTKLKIGVQTICGETDLVALLGAPLAVVGNFVVTKTSDGTSPAVTAAAIVGGHIELTGTFVTATDYTVALAAPSVLLAAGIIGYEGTKSVVISIP